MKVLFTALAQSALVILRRYGDTWDLISVQVFLNHPSFSKEICYFCERVRV